MRKFVLAIALAAVVGLPSLAQANIGCVVHRHGEAVRTHCHGVKTVAYRPGQYSRCVWKDHVFTQHGQRMHQQRQVCH